MSSPRSAISNEIAAYLRSAVGKYLGPIRGKDSGLTVTVNGCAAHVHALRTPPDDARGRRAPGRREEVVARYIKPALPMPGRVWDYGAAIDGQDDELQHEDAMLDGRPCRCETCNPPEKFVGYVAEYCGPCGGTVGPRAYGKCTIHWQEVKS